MNAKLLQIAEKRKKLVADAASQRSILGESMDQWRKPLSIADQGLQALRYVGSHPVLLVGAGVALVMFKPKRTFKWLKLGWAAWLILRRLRK